MANNSMKILAKETAIYGLSSIIGKFLNWLLVPLYTYVLAQQSDYGIVTNLTRQCFRCFGAYRFFNKDSFYIVLLAVGCQLGQILCARLAAGKNILDALLLQA